MKSIILCDDGRVETTAELCHRLHTGIEVQSFYDPKIIEGEPGLIERHQAVIKGIQPLSLHGCFGDLCPGSFDPLIRATTKQRFEQSYRIGKQLGVQYIVFHHGYIPNTSSPAGWLRRSTEFWREFLADKGSSISVGIENHLDNDYRLLSDLVDAIAFPNVKVNLDIGHANFASNIPVTEWIEKLGSRIGYTHLHDNHGTEDEHLGFGSGNIPLLEVFHALTEYAPDAVWAIETSPDSLLSSYEWLQRNNL